MRQFSGPNRTEGRTSEHTFEGKNYKSKNTFKFSNMGPELEPRLKVFPSNIGVIDIAKKVIPRAT